MSQPVEGADPEYAESVAMTGHAEDANTTFDVRIARFPAKKIGTLWMFAYIDGRQFSLVDESVTLPYEEATQVELADAVFEVAGESSASLVGTDRHARAMQGRLMASGLLHPVAHPQPGTGTVPVEMNAVFSADHAPINVRPGRIEVMGHVRGTITIDGVAYAIDLPGKWHEQTGVRSRFAPAFTYLFVQGDGRGIMTTKHANGAWGYVYENGRIRSVADLDVMPYGNNRRAFEVTLEDGGIVKGVATVVREVSVPIENKRRPGATILVESDIGTLVGVLNDWRSK